MELSFKEDIKRAESLYQKTLDKLKSKGFQKYVEWEILRKLKVYLHNKGLKIRSSILEYENYYSCILLDNYVEEDNETKILSVVIITPEDTEGSAYGKVDRLILPKYKQYLEGKESN